MKYYIISELKLKKIYSYSTGNLFRVIRVFLCLVSLWWYFFIHTIHLQYFSGLLHRHLQYMLKDMGKLGIQARKIWKNWWVPNQNKVQQPNNDNSWDTHNWYLYVCESMFALYTQIYICICARTRTCGYMLASISVRINKVIFIYKHLYRQVFSDTTQTPTP